ncbi:unnamed protein product [Amoebophrya sp. A120]|nr:unnamed protein product [Amoebophrya sp. A120]|eukprot:GSA120T00016110001.1
MSSTPSSSPPPSNAGNTSGNGSQELYPYTTPSLQARAKQEVQQQQQLGIRPIVLSGIRTPQQPGMGTNKCNSATPSALNGAPTNTLGVGQLQQPFGLPSLRTIYLGQQSSTSGTASVPALGSATVITAGSTSSNYPAPVNKALVPPSLTVPTVKVGSSPPTASPGVVQKLQIRNIQAIGENKLLTPDSSQPNTPLSTPMSSSTAQQGSTRSPTHNMMRHQPPTTLGNNNSMINNPQQKRIKQKEIAVKVLGRDLIGKAYDETGKLLDVSGLQIKGRSRGKRVAKNPERIAQLNRSQNIRGSMPTPTSSAPSGKDPLLEVEISQLFPDRDARSEYQNQSELVRHELVHTVLPDLVGEAYDDDGKPIGSPQLVGKRSRGKRIASGTGLNADGGAGGHVRDEISGDAAAQVDSELDAKIDQVFQDRDQRPGVAKPKAMGGDQQAQLVPDWRLKYLGRMCEGVCKICPGLD